MQRSLKKARTKTISGPKKKVRVQFGKDFQDETVEDYWQFIRFSDEAHVDSQPIDNEWVLRSEGTRYEPFMKTFKNLSRRIEKLRN
ncbi:hypothetical protein K402DRAFT_434770 [Aulographum hederae CBS 113979]|uniref:Uncharacterized protein n=1 Tax=Aulographum hederae CBS 113979 TaxID=1176131 RepID=A0A6G1GUR2_9PEZI|nr:hypothetical protein K402DRAFT_434770 [Aulographum hederae CBS 113979]